MNMKVLLDAGPLGMVSNPNASTYNRECYEWMESLIVNGGQILVPEIADYEVRRELLRANKTPGIARLDLLKDTIGYLPITTTVMLKAAELWAQARKSGMPTADPKALDCDVILAAQALEASAIVATENIGHLSRFVKSMHWRDIKDTE
ncbi:MAG TPA: PIN domain-containing protein [Pyrinomonadaceae bacterium]|jgi:predicted nucleic acid-binding protein